MACYFLQSILQRQQIPSKMVLALGRGGGLVVSAFANCSEDPSSNQAVFVLFVRKGENKRKRGQEKPIERKIVLASLYND